MDRFRVYTKSWVRRESRVHKKKRAGVILRTLKKTYPSATIALSFKTPVQLLVAVMLSAQCTDKKVNKVTASLFKKYRTVKDFARAKQKVLELEIHSTGFYKTKARHIIMAAQKIERDFGGELPHTMNDMITLPGIARKSANIVLGNTYGVIDGIAVDTHVSRIAQRLSLSDSDNTGKIEQDLMSLLPKKEWLRATYYIIEHGRALCTAKKRMCEACPLKKICPSSLV